MKNYFALSGILHGVILGLFVGGSTLLSRPAKSYYSVDLFSSLPAGSPGGGGLAPGLVSAPAAPAPTVPAPPIEEEEVAVPKDAIKIGKEKKKLPKTNTKTPQPAAQPAPKKRQPREVKYSYGSAGTSHSGSGGQGAMGSGSGGGGSGIIGEAGNSFPYPWYLKQIADKMDKQWKPPAEFQADTLSQIVFVISREGQISGAKIERASGDTFFDQLALRAVLYANPLPPLPTGYPDDTLTVHFKFLGKGH